jgi:ornithine carbamoyltransferase
MLGVRQVTAADRLRFLMAVKFAASKPPTVGAVKTVSTPSSRTRSPDGPPSAGKLVALFAAARRLRADSRAGANGNALRGRNLALLLTKPPGQVISPVHRAAQDLGVRVAEVPFETDPARQSEIGALARLLGRMYDAIDCGRLPPSMVRRIEREASVPVYAGLGLDHHPARIVADLLTLCEDGSAPGSQTTLLFIGDPQTSRSLPFLAAARELGFALQFAAPGDPASNDAACVVDATRPRTWSLRAHGRPIEAARRSEDHRCVIQSVLLDTIARG